MIRTSMACLMLLLTGAAGAQSGRPLCDRVSDSEAAAVIGPVQQKQSILGPDHCVFTGEGLSLMISRLPDQEPEQIDGMMKLPHNRARPGDVVKDEPDIGQRAVSESSKGQIGIFAAAGTTVWTFRVDHVYSKDLADLLPKLRDLARKVIGG